MITINRKIPPPFRTIEQIDMIKPEKSSLQNGINTFVFNAGVQEIVRVEFLFEAGFWFQDISLVSSVTNAMLNEGTKKLSSAEIAEKLDYFGSYLQTYSNNHFASVTLYSLNKYLDQSLAIIEDILKNSIFPEKEFETYIKKRRQAFIIENEKVETLARNKFSEVLFGYNHPYGKPTFVTDFDNLRNQQLIDFYNERYNGSTCQIIIAGKVSDNAFDLMNKYFGGKDWLKPITDKKPEYKVEPLKELKHFIEKKDAVQSAIQIGKKMFTKKHHDFAGFYVLNTIFGGYFGSRLMTNIREDKGYTYGIESALAGMRHSGYFSIQCTVGTEVWKKAIDEIYNEIKKLKIEIIPKEELDIVKNYMLGEMLRAFDGPFGMATSFKSLLNGELDYNFYENLINTVKNITPLELNDLANRYFIDDTFYEVVAGAL